MDPDQIAPLISIHVVWQNSDDPDEMPHNVAFHQGLHCLLKKTLHYNGTTVQKRSSFLFK